MKLKSMEILKITSAQNPTIKKIAKLSQSAKARREAQLVVLDGAHLCQEWPQEFVHLVMTESFRQTHEGQQFTSKNLVVVSDFIMEKLAPTKTPSGILGVISRPNQAPPAQQKLILCLESIQDPGNVGTIIRTAAATGADAIYLSADCADVWSPKVLRAGMGGHFKLALIENFELTNIKNVFAGTLYGTFMNGQNLFETDFADEVGFVMGNEGAGVSTAMRDLCDQEISIPMQNNVESLNVAMATGLCLYEVSRQA